MSSIHIFTSCLWSEMEQEIHVHENNNTCSLITLHVNKISIGCKWVYKFKYWLDGSLKHHKACVVVKGQNKQDGLDNRDVFFLFSKLVIVCCLLAIPLAQNFTTTLNGCIKCFVIWWSLWGSTHEAFSDFQHTGSNRFVISTNLFMVSWDKLLISGFQSCNTP